MGKKKLKKGCPIATLDHMYKCEWVIIHDKPYNRGWVMSWQFRVAGNYVEHGIAFEGVRLTNGEYFANLTDDEIKERFGEDLHILCPWREIRLGANALCEGEYCDEAIENWKGEAVK